MWHLTVLSIIISSAIQSAHVCACVLLCFTCNSSKTTGCANKKLATIDYYPKVSVRGLGHAMMTSLSKVIFLAFAFLTGKRIFA